MGLFSKREANQTERQVWALIATTDEIMDIGRTRVETHIGPTTPEYDRLEQNVFGAATAFNQAYSAKEWRTLGDQNSAWNAAMNDLNAYMEENNYGPRIEAAETETGANT